MNFDLKSHLFGLAGSDEVKGLVCDLVDNYVKDSDNKIDDRLATGLRAAMFDKGSI